MGGNTVVLSDDELEKTGVITVNGAEVEKIEFVDLYIGDVEISKTAVGGGAEISGAHLTVTDSKGNVIDEWTCEDGKIHTIPGSKLKAGETYTLTEAGAPYGYAYAESIVFIIDENGNVTDEDGNSSFESGSNDSESDSNNSENDSKNTKIGIVPPAASFDFTIYK